MKVGLLKITPIAILLPLLILLLPSANAQLSGKSHDAEIKFSTGSEIRGLLKKINTDLQIDDANLAKLIELFKSNEYSTDNDFFSQSGDDELFYKTIKYLKSKIGLDIDCLRFIIKLSFVIKKNIEINEYLSELIPELALLNTNNFVRIYGELE